LFILCYFEHLELLLKLIKIKNFSDTCDIILHLEIFYLWTVRILSARCPNESAGAVDDVKVVKRELPKVKKGIDELYYINSVLKGRLDYALDDISNIDSMYRSGNIKDIGTVLSKYDFSIKIDS